ncbi:hypothetical protein [Rhodopila sp.]|uniref:hypothetical protein n=1 Tax=Rhodopila sp. TaxID=2480087 RepID=UPI003D0F3E36
MTAVIAQISGRRLDFIIPLPCAGTQVAWLGIHLARIVPPNKQAWPKAAMNAGAAARPRTPTW